MGSFGESEEEQNEDEDGMEEEDGDACPDSASPLYGTLLENFLRYIGEGNILGRHGYSARAGGFRFQINTEPGVGGGNNDTASGINYDGAMLVVEDPCTPENNLSAHTYKMSEVQKAFNDALESFRRGAVRSDPLMDIFNNDGGYSNNASK